MAGRRSGVQPDIRPKHMCLLSAMTATSSRDIANAEDASKWFGILYTYHINIKGSFYSTQISKIILEKGSMFIY